MEDFQKKYLAKLPHIHNFSDHLTGETTPSYIFSVKAPSLIHSVMPNVRLILILRNPTERAFSEYNMKRRRVEIQLNMDKEGDSLAVMAVINSCYNKSNKTYIDFCLRSELRRIPRFEALIKRKTSNLESILACLPYTSLPPSIKQVQLCFREVPSREFVLPFERIVRSEMDLVRQCSKTATEEIIFKWGVPSCWENGTSANIQNDYVVRGLYATQIRGFLNIFKHEQLLVVADSDLRNTPKETMNRVFAHVGLSNYDISHVTEKDVIDKIRAQWPVFENKTGWQLNSKYYEMDSEIRKELTEFYKPYNADLYRLLGRDFGWNN